MDFRLIRTSKGWEDYKDFVGYGFPASTPTHSGNPQILPCLVYTTSREFNEGNEFYELNSVYFDHHFIYPSQVDRYLELFKVLKNHV